jgi:hypothetical protein
MMVIAIASGWRWVSGLALFPFIICLLRWLIHDGCKACQQVLHRIPTKGKGEQVKITNPLVSDGEGDLGSQTWFQLDHAPGVLKERIVGLQQRETPPVQWMTRVYDDDAVI